MDENKLPDLDLEKIGSLPDLDLGGVKKKGNSESLESPLSSLSSEGTLPSALFGKNTLGDTPQVDVAQISPSETQDKTTQDVLRQKPSLFKRYVQGIPKALNEEISSDLKLLDWVQEKATSGVTQLLFGKEVESARKQLSDAGVLSNRPFKFASDLIDEKLIAGQADLPDDIPGSIVKGVVKTLPLIMETAVMPEVTVGKAMTKYGVGDLLKFPLVVSTKEGTTSLKETEGLPPEEQASEFAKSVGLGFKTGLEMSMLGKGTSTLAKNITDKLFKESIVGVTSRSQLNNILASKNLTENTISSLSMAVGFGGIGAAEEFIETGKVTPKNVAVQAGMGLAFGLTGLSGALFGKAMTSLSGARNDMILNSVRSEKDPAELKRDAENIVSEAEIKTGEEQKKDVVSAVANDNAANLKAITDDIKENPNGYLEQISGSTLPEEMKSDLVNKVNLIVSESDIRHVQAKPIVNEINGKLKQVENISNNPNYSQVEKDAMIKPIQGDIDVLKQKVEEIYNPVKKVEQKPPEEPADVKPPEITKEELPIEEVKPEITEEVKTDIQTVINEVSQTPDPQTKGKTKWGDIEGGDGKFLYEKSKELKIEYKSEGTPESEKLTILENEGYLEYDNGNYTLTESGKQFVDAVDERLKTREGIKEGTDLFPETANIPEVKTIKQEVKVKFQSIADKIRQSKITENLNQPETFGISDTKLWNDALESAAKIIETTGDFAQALSDGLSKLKSEEDKEKFKKTIEDLKKSELPEKEQTTIGLGETKEKSVLNRLMTSENLSPESKKGLEEKGLSYNVQTHEEARKISRDVIDVVGIDDAVIMAEAGKFGGAVNSLIFAESLDRIGKLEDASKNPEEQQRLATQWAEISTRYDNAARESGRFSSSVQDFYKKSPLGMVVKENINRNKLFKDWLKNKEGSFKEVFDEIVSTEKGKLLLKDKFGEFQKEERRINREIKRQKISDIFDNAKLSKEVMYSTIIPPQFINGGIELMKQAVLAGESVANAIKIGIDHISSKLEKDWDKERFRKEWIEKLKDIDKTERKSSPEEEKLLSRITSLEKAIATYESKARAGDFKMKEKKAETDPEVLKLIEQRDQAREDYQKLREQSEEWKKRKSEMYLNRFRKKLKGLSEEKKEQVLQRSMKRLLDNGALEYNDFKKIIADIIGLGELSPEQTNKIKELVKKINYVEDARLKALEEETPQSISEYRKAERESEIASRELATMVYKKADPITTLWGIMRLNTLGLVTLLMNPAYNITFRPVELIKAGLLTAGDYTIYGGSKLLNKVSNKIPVYNPTHNIFLAQRGYFKEMGHGLMKSLRQFQKGTRSMDYFADTKAVSSIRPWRSLKDLYSWIKDDLFLTNAQVVDKFLQATPIGINAEFIARSLNLGDMPFRFGSGGGEGEQLAKLEFHLKYKNNINLFMAFPKEQSYKYYKEKGLSDEEAQKKSDYIVRRIVGKGEKSVMQNENYINEFIKLIDRGAPIKETDNPSLKAWKSVGNNLIKAVRMLNMPYAKIPLNVAWNVYNLVNPSLAFSQSVYFGAKAVYNKSKGNNIAARELADASADWLAHGIAGIALTTGAGYLLSKGLINPSDADEKKRGAEGQTLYGKNRSLNVTAMRRMVKGGPTNIQDGDLLVDLQWYGILGNILNVKYGVMEAEKQAGDKKEEWDFIDGVMESMKQATAEVAVNGVFSGTTGMIKAINQGGGYADAWVMNMINLGMNVVQPATFAQLSRATLGYKASWRADSFLKEVAENAKTRSMLIRNKFGYPQSAITMWGDPATKEKGVDAVLFNMLRVSKYDNNKFGSILYQDYLRTKNDKFFPPSIQNTISFNGERVKLSTQEYRDLQVLVGKYRKDLVSPFLYDMASIDGKKYSEMEDSNKTETLNMIYEEGYDSGLFEFKETHPKYNDN